MLRPSLYIFTLFLTLLSVTFTAGQGFDYSKYSPRTLTELVDLNQGPGKMPDEKRLDYVSANWFYSQVRLKFIGSSRPISVERREIISNWQKAFSIPSETAALFKQEYLFKECDREIWLPVQAGVAAHFDKELKSAEMVTVYLFLAGGRRTSGKMELVFLMSEFEK